MKIEKLRQILQKYNGNVEINFADRVFGGAGEVLTEDDIFCEDGEVLISPPYWEDVD